MAIRDWVSDAWEWFVPGQDDQGIFSNIGDWFGGDDETEYEDISSFDESLFDASGDYLGYDPSTGSIDDWLDTLLETEDMDWMDDLGFSFGDWGADDYPDPFQGTGTQETWGGDDLDTGIFGGTAGPKWRDFFLGSGGTGGNRQGGGIMGLLNSLLGGGGQGGGGLLGGGGLGTLASLWALNKARKEGSDPGAIIPMGQQAYGMEDVYGGPTPDYRVFNIQPALMPGVAYANVGKPEGMEHGGIKGGPGDVTPAWLEPGEFVMTKKATGNIGAQNLYKMMKDAEGMG